MMTTLRTSLPITFAILLAGSLAVAGEAKTPLGKWMKPNMGAPLAGQDFATLKTSFDTVGGKAPPSGDFPQWAAITKAGSDAAGKQDLAGVKAACKQCHDAYKKKYVDAFPTRPFP